jgi:hypothetical protein
MSQHGTDLAVDLNELLFLARVDLPLLQYTYATLNKTVAGVQPRSAFVVVPVIGYDQVTTDWVDVTAHLQDIFAETADTLGASAQAILHVEAVYEATDTVARDAINAEWKAGTPHSHGLPQEMPLPGSVPPVVYSNH